MVIPRCRVASPTLESSYFSATSLCSSSHDVAAPFLRLSKGGHPTATKGFPEDEVTELGGSLNQALPPGCDFALQEGRRPHPARRILGGILSRLHDAQLQESDMEEQEVVTPVVKRSRFCLPEPPGRTAVKSITVAGISQLPENAVEFQGHPQSKVLHNAGMHNPRRTC